MEQLKEFQKVIEPFLPKWKSLEVRALGDVKNNALLSMVACLTPDNPASIEIAQEMQELVFLRGSMPAAGLAEMLTSWEAGAVQLGPFKLGTEIFPRPEVTSLVATPDGYLLHGWPEYATCPHISLRCWATRNLEELIRPRDSWAISRILGFRGFDELAFARLGFQVGGAYSLIIRIFAPLLVKLDTKLEPTAASIFVEFATPLSPEKFSLTYRIEDPKGNRLDGGVISPLSLEAGASDLGLRLSSQLSLPRQSARLELLLFYSPYRKGKEPVAVYRSEVPIPAGRTNPRLVLIQSLISNTREWTKGSVKPEDVLQKWLGLSGARPGGGGKDNEFERGVHCLLFLAGCTFLPIGNAEGVDVAIVDNEVYRTAVLISCTTSPDISRKVADLLLQRNRLKERLPDFSVRAGIFVPIQRDDLTIRNANESREQGVTLILLPELRSLYNETVGRDWDQAARKLLAMLTPSDRGLP